MTTERAVRPETEAEDPYPRRLLVTILSAIVVFSSSMTLVSASLPTIADDLDSDVALLAWAVTGLFLMMAVGTPVLGRLGDLHGHRKVFLTGAVVLSVGTALCGLAPTAETFVAARMVVGLGIAATMPNSMALIMAAYPAERRTEAMGWFQMSMVGAPVLGLIVGGPLIDAFGWRVVFAVLTPIGVSGTVAAWRVIRPSPGSDDVTIDWAGAAALAVGTLALLLHLELVRSRGFTDPSTVGLLGVSLVGVLVFIAIEQRVKAPMLKLAYFRVPNFSGPLIAQPLTQFAYMGGFLISPLFLEDVYGFSVSAVALLLLPRPLAYSLASPIGGRLAGRLGTRPMIIAGSLLMLLSMLMATVGARFEILFLFVASFAVAGMAMGVASPSYATTITGAVDPADMGVANGMGTTMMNIGMLTGIQTMFVVLGEGREPADFALVFVVGAVVAALSTVGGLIVRPSDR